ncbi:hypothetical protein [Periweissella ghanensis]|uniref:Uncharacterized protein n=1 Tax=Periweissella ghanensis TaxID=467997 RepID=A0ABM8ZAS9_9LACO|nr:hypothetical protein [Periweissella ghanensis]MCM0601186.1 hypothetical protein [Periweissella ghanensis]CAH0417984.1 hypothetical protein WGH24286_00400 [Periweissella ghanensis]
MSKRMWIGLVTLTSAVVLSACGSQGSSSHSSNGDAASHSSAQASHKSKMSSQTTMHKAVTPHNKDTLASVKVPKLIWDNQKQAALNAFVSAWGNGLIPHRNILITFLMCK